MASEQSVDEEGRIHWSLDLKAGVPTSIARSMCWLEFVPGAATIADQTSVSLVNQIQLGKDHWIRAAPPISQGVLRIKAQVKWLHRSNALLVTQLLDFKPDIQVATITCTVPERTIYTGNGEDKPGGDKANPTPGPKPKPGPIGKPRDRRHTDRHFDFSGNPMQWFGLPPTEVSAKRTRKVPMPGTPVRPREEVEVASSVGETSGNGRALPSAQITPQMAEQLRDRFEEVVSTLNRLVEWKLIDRWKYFSIFIPIKGMYCSFPVLKEPAVHRKVERWSLVNGRSRVALVLTLEVRGRTIYWIEIEPVPRNFKALAVEMLDGKPLDELTLSALLEGCANTGGIWDVTLEFARPLKMIAKGHASNREKRLSVNVFMGAIAQLGAMSGQLEETASEIVEGRPGQLTEHVALNAVIPH